MAAPRQPLPNVAWFDIDDPNSPALDEIASKYNLHELQMEDCRHRPQRARAEEYDTYIFVVLKHIVPGKARLTFDDLDMFLGRDFLVTVHTGASEILDGARKRAEEQKANRLDRLFYMIIDAVVDQYQPTLDAVAEQTSDIESAVLDRPDPDVLADIFRLKRRLIGFRQHAANMREVVNALVRREGGLVGDDLDPYFRDVYDHLVRTVEMIETYRDLLTGSLDIYLSAVANRTNEVVKVLTIWGTVALPLVIITGFFGMNLKLPWEATTRGTLYALALMVASTIAILVYFRRKHWF